MNGWLRGGGACVGLILLGVLADPGRSQVAQQMVVTTPFTQGKFTDGAGNVSYRVGGVFAEPADASRRLSMTFICQTGKLSLFTVQTRVPQKATSGAAKIGLQVDDQAAEQFDAMREVGKGLSAYTISTTTDVVGLAKRRGMGEKLRLQLDEYAYDLPLQGLGVKLRDLQAVCPYGG